MKGGGHTFNKANEYLIIGIVISYIRINTNLK